MRIFQAWSIALPLASVSVIGLLCLTAIQFQEGNLQIYFAAPGGIKMNAVVDKSALESEKTSSLTTREAGQCPIRGTTVIVETN